MLQCLPLMVGTQRSGACSVCSARPTPDPAVPLHCSHGRVQATLAREGQPVGVRPIQQPDGCVAVMPYPACLHHATSFSLHIRLLRLGALHCDTLAVAAGALKAAALWVLLCVLAHQVIGLMFWLLHVSRLLAGVLTQLIQCGEFVMCHRTALPCACARFHHV